MARYRDLLLNYVLPLAFVGVLYVTGLHTPFIGYLQQGILATGVFRPDTELALEAADRRSATPTTENLDFHMIDREGRPVDAKELAGKVVFLNLWASWCAPCLAEMPNIDALYADYAQDDRIAFVLLNVERDFSKGLELVEGRGYAFPVYGRRDALPASLSSGTLPTTYLIAPSGAVVLTHEGMANYDTEAFRGVLAGLME
jgi:thiol-disulfide isomerase/thioredoxin